MTDKETPVFALTPSSSGDGLADLAAFLRRTAGGPAILDAGDAPALGALAAQLLLAARRSPAPPEIATPSDRFVGGMRLLGLEAEIVGER